MVFSLTVPIASLSASHLLLFTWALKISSLTSRTIRLCGSKWHFVHVLKARTNVARFEVSQLQTWNLSFFPFFFLKCFSHFLNFVPFNEKQYLHSKPQSFLWVYSNRCMLYFWLFLYTRKERLVCWGGAGGNQMPKQETKPSRVPALSSESCIYFHYLSTSEF